MAGTKRIQYKDRYVLVPVQEPIDNGTTQPTAPNVIATQPKSPNVIATEPTQPTRPNVIATEPLPPMDVGLPVEGSRENPWADAAQANLNPPTQYDPRVHTGVEETDPDWLNKHMIQQPIPVAQPEETLRTTSDPYAYMERIGMVAPAQAGVKSVPYTDQWMTNPDPAAAQAELQAGGDLEADRLRKQQAYWEHRQRVDALNARDALNGIPRNPDPYSPDPAGYGPAMPRGY